MKTTTLRTTIIALLACLWIFPTTSPAQDYNQLTNDGTFTAAGYQQNRNNGRSDSIQSQHKEIPRGLKVWTIDERFGDRIEAEPDTLPHLFMNTIFTTGLLGEYNTTGNLGSPRINRIFIDRADPTNFSFTEPYDFFITPISDFHFTNTLSPITNLSFNSCGNRTNGEDHLKALFAVNAGKRLGLGFKFDYLYGRGYYSNQNTSHTNFTAYASYLGDRYQVHFVASNNHQKVAENGGVTNDSYITHPESYNESFAEDEIPTLLEKNWNRNDNQHLYLNQRYSIGFRRKVPMTEDEIAARKFAIRAQQENAAAEAKRKARERARRNGDEFDEEEYDREQRSAGRPTDARIAGDAPTDSIPPLTNDTTRIIVDSKEKADSLLALEQTAKTDTTWMKDEYVPVTSFIHTASFDRYRRIYEAYATPQDFYLEEYYNAGKFTGDSIYDATRHWELRNTFAVALLEGFNKYAKAGLKGFITHSLRQFTLPDRNASAQTFNENAISVGGQLNKTQGTLLHYNLTGEVGVVGADAGEIQIDADADLNFRLLGDTVQLAARGFFHNTQPTFYQRHYQSRHFWWDNENDFSSIIHTRLEGLFSLKRTKTQLRVAFDELKNYVYLAQSYDITEGDNDLLRTNVTAAMRQHSSPITLLTLQLRQDFRLGILNWENVLTYQKSTEQDILPVPALNVYTNLYIKFKIARVLDCDLGADMRYFTRYYAPDYSPALGQYAIQDTGDNRVKIGNYPIVNAYANFFLKHTRFFVMFSHVNYSEGGEYFLTPHYPLNQRLFRFGLSWNFFN